MWLINVKTLQLESFDTSECPPYSILSHTWKGKEITFQQFQNRDAWPTFEQTPQFRKIMDCCKLTQSNGYKYTWADTCCIDKTNSAELSEAINSMFKWYNQAAVCYVFLSEVPSKDFRRIGAGGANLQADLSASTWFWRGWTLQELIAPPKVYFFDSTWSFIAARSRIADVLSDITGIDVSLLRWPELARVSQEEDFIVGPEARNGKSISRPNLHQQRPPRARELKTNALDILRGHLDSYTIAQRMSWAASRKTTRIEDRAYSLLGIFDTNLPLIYGEGSKAFLRLQEEIMKNSTDHSILAWNHAESSFNPSAHLWDPGSKHGRLLAPSPDSFSGASKIVYYRTSKETEGVSFEMTNLGLRINLPMVDSQAVLNCAMSNNLTGPLALCLARGIPVGYYVDNKVTAANSRMEYSSRLVIVPREELRDVRPQSLILLREVTPPRKDLALQETGFRIRGNHPGFKVHVIDTVPGDYGFGGAASRYAITLPFAKDLPHIAALRIELEMESEGGPYFPSGKLDIVFGVDADSIDSPPHLWGNSNPYVRAFRSNNNKLSTRREAALTGIRDAKKNSLPFFSQPLSGLCAMHYMRQHIQSWNQCFTQQYA